MMGKTELETFPVRLHSPFIDRDANLDTFLVREQGEGERDAQGG